MEAISENQVLLRGIHASPAQRATGVDGEEAASEAAEV